MPVNTTAEEPSALVIADALQEYQRLSHHTVTVEAITVVSCTTLLPTIRSWHFNISGEAIRIWESFNPLPRKEEAQEVAA